MEGVTKVTVVCYKSSQASSWLCSLEGVIDCQQVATIGDKYMFSVQVKLANLDALLAADGVLSHNYSGPSIAFLNNKRDV